MSREETRRQILDVTLKLFAERGFAATSMNDIVRESGLSKGGIYWHFKSKDEIVATIFDEYFGAQIEMLIAFKEREGTSSERLHALMTLIAESMDSFGAEFPEPLEFYALAAHQPDLLERLKQHFVVYKAHLTELIQQGIDAGEFHTGDAAHIANILIGAVEGLILLHTFSDAGSTKALQSRLLTAVNLILASLRRDDV